MYISLWPHYSLRFDSACHRKEHQDYILEGEDGRCVGLITLPLSSADSLEVLEPQPPGTLWPVRGQYRYHLLSVSKHMVIGVAYLVEWQGQYRYHLLSVGTYGNWSSVLGGVAKSVQVSLTVCV